MKSVKVQVRDQPWKQATVPAWEKVPIRERNLALRQIREKIDRVEDNVWEQVWDQLREPK